jgi:hypothetical protein
MNVNIINKPKKLRKIEDEEWRVVPETENRYFVSNYGRVKSFTYNKTEGQIMKCSVVNSFKTVEFKIHNKSKRYYLHKLVAQVWLPKPPSEEHKVVIHLDWNFRNNHVNNLEWATDKIARLRTAEFLRQKYKDSKRPKIINRSKLKETDVMHIKSMLQRQVPQSKIAQMFCISGMQVSRIKRGENWSHITIPSIEK